VCEDTSITKAGSVGVAGDKPPYEQEYIDKRWDNFAVRLSPTAESTTSATQVVSADPSELESRLSSANVRLSGGSSARVDEVRSYLQNELGYQRLAQNILQLVGTRRLKDPVDLDLINGYYIQQVNKTADSLLPDQYDDVEKLKTAILLAWSELYPARKTDVFDAIVQ
jgi:hypothetical protein